MGMIPKKKSKMGRPPKRPEDRQSEVVLVRLTKADRRLLEAEAGAEGLPLGTYLRKCWKERTR